MTATHNNPRRTAQHAPYGRRLPRLGWWWLTIPVLTAAAIKTWPIPATILIALGGITLVLTVVRPRWARPLLRTLQRAGRRGTAIPARGRRTLADFQHMNPTRFEQAVAELAREDPSVVQATTVGGANDRGADVLVHLTDGRRILIQCKRYRDGNNIGSDVVQTINGVYRDIHHCHQAVIVTTANFTPAAHDTNRMLPQPIRLIDGHHLEAWANGTAPAPW